MKIRLVTFSAVVLAGALAPSATAALVQSDRTCYREGSAAKFVGTGFQPGQPIAISIDGQQIATDQASAAGTIGGSISSLTQIPRSQQVRALSMTQTTNPALTATRTFLETKLYVVTKPSSFRPGRRLAIRAGGFYGAGPNLYGHVRGPKKRNLRVGRVRGDCGKVAATKKVILRRGDRPGFYLVQFDTARRYLGRRTVLQYRRGYTIRRIFRFSRSSPFSSPVLGGGGEWVPDA